MTQPFLQLKNVSKIFPGVKALNYVDLDVYPGEVHGLIGENGAGKSTLIKILTGAHRHDSGQMFVEGQEIKFNSAKYSMQLGITAIYQELNIVKELSVYENVFLGREMKKSSKSVLLDINLMKERARQLLSELGQNIDPGANIANLGLGKQQMVEIAKALSIHTKLLIMDEPTSSLSGKEVRELLRTVRELKNRGIGIIFISHRLDEVLDICDRITVMRDGKKIKTLPVQEASVDELIKLMVGRSLEQQFPKVKVQPGEELLRVEKLTRRGSFENVSFNLHRGEILGVAGLVGSGRTEVARAIFGADELDCGEIYIKGQKVRIKSPKDAMNHGIAFLTEDRKGQGMVLDNTVDFNMNLASYDKGKSGLLLDLQKLKALTLANIKKLNLNPPSASFIVGQLSGGNQQKVVIGKWLNTKANIYIIDEPTRGIDVGAKVEVYNVINELVTGGAAVLMISSELPELLGMSDRIITMSEGKVTAEFTREKATQENIMRATTGGI